MMSILFHSNFLFAEVRLQIVAGPGHHFGINGVLSQVCKINDVGWKLHWIKPDKEIVPGAKLVVRNLTQKDFGVYTCIATKKFRRVGVSIKVSG